MYRAVNHIMYAQSALRDARRVPVRKKGGATGCEAMDSPPESIRSFKQLIDDAPNSPPPVLGGVSKGVASSSREAVPAMRKTRSFKVEGRNAKSAFVGSLTEMQSPGNYGAKFRVQMHSRGPAIDPGSVSMSSAPVETLTMGRGKSRRRIVNVRPSRMAHLRSWVAHAIYPERARIAVPLDSLAFLFCLGIGSGLLGIAMDLAIEKMASARESMLLYTLRSFNESRPVRQRDHATTLRYEAHGARRLHTARSTPFHVCLTPPD